MEAEELKQRQVNDIIRLLSFYDEIENRNNLLEIYITKLKQQLKEISPSDYKKLFENNDDDNLSH